MAYCAATRIIHNQSMPHYAALHTEYGNLVFTCADCGRRTSQPWRRFMGVNDHIKPHPEGWFIQCEHCHSEIVFSDEEIQSSIDSARAQRPDQGSSPW